MEFGVVVDVLLAVAIASRNRPIVAKICVCFMVVAVIVSCECCMVSFGNPFAGHLRAVAP